MLSGICRIDGGHWPRGREGGLRGLWRGVLEKESVFSKCGKDISESGEGRRTSGNESDAGVAIEIVSGERISVEVDLNRI